MTDFSSSYRPNWNLDYVAGRAMRSSAGKTKSGSENEDERLLDHNALLEASESGWLNLTDVGEDERGWYQCVSKHTFGDFSSNSVFINVQRE